MQQDQHQQLQQQQLQRMVQPGQVLVRQIIPGMSQPVLRAVTLQPGQVIQAGQPLPTIQRPNLPTQCKFFNSKIRS